MSKHPKHKTIQILKKESAIRPPSPEITKPKANEVRLPTLEEQLQELKKPFFIAKGNFEMAIDDMLGKSLAQGIQLAKIVQLQKLTIDKFKKLVPKSKWPKIELSQR